MKTVQIILTAAVPILIFSLLTAIISPEYVTALFVALLFLILLIFRKIKPVWIASFVFIIAPFYDILRATYLKNVRFIGVWQEMFVLVLFFAFLVNLRRRDFKFPRLGLIDLLVVVYVVWNFAQVFQSPSIGAGLYVWRWYSLGPLLYFLFRFFPLDHDEEWDLYRATCIGLVAAAVYAFYQYFIMGPENAAQFVSSLGFTAFYRIGWRLPGPFSSPLVASACFSILLLFGLVLLLKEKKFIWGLLLFGVGALAIFITLSRSGIAIAMFGIFAILVLSFSRIKRKIPVFLLGIAIIVFLLFQFPKIFPQSLQFVNFAFSTDLNQYDIGRFGTFKDIVADAFTKYPLGFGFGGGGAISQTAFALFGGDSSQLMPADRLGGDSVFFATLQSSGFFGFIIIVSVFCGFAWYSLRVLQQPRQESNRGGNLFLAGFFIGMLLTLANLTDVWPIKLYVWTFGAMTVNHAFHHTPFQLSWPGRKQTNPHE